MEEKLTRSEALKKIAELEDYIQQLPKQTILEEAVESLGKNVYNVRDDSANVRIEGNYLKVPLPLANKEWTFSAWDYAKRFCQKYPDCFPEHQQDRDFRFVYINCGQIKL